MVEGQVEEQRLARNWLEPRWEVHEAGLLGDERRVQAKGVKPFNQGLEVKAEVLIPCIPGGTIAMPEHPAHSVPQPPATRASVPTLHPGGTRGRRQLNIQARPLTQWCHSAQPPFLLPSFLG